MKHLKSIFLFIVAIFISFNVQTSEAQITSNQTRENIQTLKDWAREPRVLADLPNTEVNGSPYYNEDWATGYVQVNKNTQSNAVKLKYSSYTNEVLFQENGRTRALPSDALVGFTLIKDNKEIEFKNGFHSEEYDITPNQLMRVIYGGDVKLLAKEYVNLHHTQDPFTGETKYDFLDETDFYLVSADGSFNKIKLKKKDILKALGQKQDALKEFADSHNLDFDNEYHASLILKHYDKLNQSN